MLRGRNPLDCFRKHQIEPKIYRVTCTKCNFSEKLELENDSVCIWRNPEVDHSQDARVVSELPELCQACGARLKIERIPVRLRY